MVKTLEKTEKIKSAKVASKEELEVAAYFHWLNRGCPSNDDLTDWIEAEKAIVSASRSASPKRK